MTGPKLLLGIDAGLTNVKVAAFDPDGTSARVVSRSTPGVAPAPDRDEQEHDALWQTVVEALTELIGGDGIDSDRIAAVGVAGHGHGLYALDEDGGQAFRGIKSTDSRTAELREELDSDGALDAVTEAIGWRPFGADPLTLLAWLERNDRAAYDRIDRLLFCKDLIAYRMTGCVGTDEMEGTALYGTGTGDAERAYERLGIEACLDARPDIVPSTAEKGTVTTEAAAATGIPAETPVAAGLHDVGACALGAGAITAGQGVAIVGTWGQSILVSDERPAPDDPGIARRYPGGWLSYRGNRAATACLDWFTEECCQDWREAADGGVDQYTVFEEKVQSVSPGADGVRFRPYLRGSTDDPGATAGFDGLRMRHTKEHMLRAVYEGVAASQCAGLDALAGSAALDDVRITGGGARSEVWCDIFANLLRESLAVPDTSELGARGAALCGGVAADIYADIETAVDGATGVESVYEPSNPEAYEDLRDWFGPSRSK